MSKGEQSRARIIDAAQQLFYEKGVNASSMADVADVAGLLKGNLSYYFPTKTDLLQAVVEQRKQALDALLGRFVAASDDPVRQLGLFINMIEQSGPELVQHGCPLGSLASEICKGGDEYLPLGAQLLGICADWLAARFASRMTPTQAARSAEQLLAMAQGTAVLAQAFHDPALVKRQCAVMRDWIAGQLKPHKR